jgi:hypothetical protein
MSSNDPQEQEQGKGLQRLVKFWKITWPVWLVIVAGCGILWVGMFLFRERISQWFWEVFWRISEEVG